MQAGVIRTIHTGYVSGPVADAIADGSVAGPAILQTAGGRARSSETGELIIDIAFIAAPTADDYGNLYSSSGPNACGTLGNAMVDVRFAKAVVAVTDNLASYPVFRPPSGRVVPCEPRSPGNVRIDVGQLLTTRRNRRQA